MEHTWVEEELGCRMFLLLQMYPLLIHRIIFIGILPFRIGQQLKLQFTMEMIIV
jgi:hypothetical protein